MTTKQEPLGWSVSPSTLYDKADNAAFDTVDNNEFKGWDTALFTDDGARLADPHGKAVQDDWERDQEGLYAARTDRWDENYDQFERQFIQDIATHLRLNPNHAEDENLESYLVFSEEAAVAEELDEAAGFDDAEAAEAEEAAAVETTLL